MFCEIILTSFFKSSIKIIPLFTRVCPDFNLIFWTSKTLFIIPTVPEKKKKNDNMYALSLKSDFNIFPYFHYIPVIFLISCKSINLVYTIPNLFFRIFESFPGTSSIFFNQFWWLTHESCLREYYRYAVSQVYVLVVSDFLTSLQCCQIRCAIIEWAWIIFSFVYINSNNWWINIWITH